MSLPRSSLRLRGPTIDRFADRLNRAVRREVSAYAVIDEPKFNQDVRAVNRLNVVLFFKALSEDRGPNAAELADWGRRLDGEPRTRYRWRRSFTAIESACGCCGSVCWRWRHGRTMAGWVHSLSNTQIE
ncbi:MAG: hypothetical protein WAM30_01430 [Candidatus Dormiibacterota bacterium]